MSNVFIVNTAVFLAVAALHALRLGYQSPVSVGGIDIPLWLSAFALVGGAFLAWLNWQAVAKRGKAEILKLLLALVVIDAAILLFSWFAGLAYWGLAGDAFLWFVLFDLVLVAIISNVLAKRPT